MKNQLLFSISLLLGCLSFSPLAFAQLPPDCGGPPTDVPPADDCMGACIYCNFNGLLSSTDGYAANVAPPGFCSTVENDQWIGFLAGSPSTVLTITPSNCTNGNGLQAALFAGCNQPPLLCEVGQQGGGSTPLVLNASNLIPGKHYYLMVDGYAGDQCDFSVSVSPTNIQPPMGKISQIIGPAQVCPGGTATYQVPRVYAAGAYQWMSMTSGVLFNEQPSPSMFIIPEGESVNMTFPSGITGNVSLCVTPANSCNMGEMKCRTINVQPIPATNLPAVFFCQHDSLPPGVKIYEFKYKSWLGCDSLIR